MKRFIVLVFLFGCHGSGDPVPVSAQEQIDKSGVFNVPEGFTDIDQPLFMNNQSRIVGLGQTRSKVRFRGGYGVVIGWARGLVGDEHYTKDGFRTFGKAYPIDIGGDLSLGPHTPGPTGEKGWRSVRKFQLKIKATKHYPGRWLGGSQEFTVLCGAQEADELFPGPRPSPIVAYVQGSFYFLSYRTGTGEIKQASVRRPDAKTEGDTIDVDFGEIEVPDGLWQNTRWPFGIGQAPPSAAMARGYWGSGGGLQDITFNEFSLQVDNLIYKPDWTRPATYDGGKSLPLINLKGQHHYNKCLLVFHADQTYSTDAVNDADIRDVYLWCGNHQPLIGVGANMGGTRIANCELYGGSRAVQSMMNWVHYPLKIRDCNIHNQSDCNVFLVRASGVIVDGCNLAYGSRCTAETWGCQAVFRGPMMIPPPGPPAPQDAVFIQHGGRCVYDQCIVDYEYKPAAKSFLQLRGMSCDIDTFSTTARIFDCFSGNQQYTVEILPTNQPSYKGRSLLTIHGGIQAERKVRKGNKDLILEDGTPLKW